MNTYYIHEANMERLNKKIATIQKKCIKNKLEFTFNVVGEEVRPYTDSTGVTYNAKFYLVEVDGQLKYDGWKFVAVLDHHAEGNIIRAFDTEIAIPDKYRTCGPECEHCKKIRSRKDTYLLFNDEQNKFIQVGKSCLQEFTNGLSAEEAAFFVSVYDSTEDLGGYSGSSYKSYTIVKDTLRYAFECYHHFGYEKLPEDYEYEYDRRSIRTTRMRVSDYMACDAGKLSGLHKEAAEDEMRYVHFDASSEYAVSMTEGALEWIKSCEKDNDYLRNLGIICSEEFTETRNFGILVSLPAAYGRYLEHKAYEEKKAAKREADKAAGLVSTHQGNIGDRLTINVSSMNCISSWENMYGMTFMYKIVDENNNVYVWYASKCIDDTEKVTKLVGTVKDHSEYDNVAQTVLTRCKVA